MFSSARKMEVVQGRRVCDDDDDDLSWLIHSYLVIFIFIFIKQITFWLELVSINTSNCFIF